MNLYGKDFPTEDRQAIELWCFANDPPGGLGVYQHLRNSIDLIWNQKFPATLIWNDFSERMLKSFCEHRWVTVTGPGASWKTTCAAIYVLCRWYSSPHNTVVICTSTTLDGLRRRIWKEITRFHRLRPLYGHAVAGPPPKIQYRKGDDNSGIFGIATDKGEIEKALGKIIGFHSPNEIVLVDEMPYTPEAIVEACVNLQSGSQRFEFKGLGNADDHLDPHGRMSEPTLGWDSIDVESQEWHTQRGVCIHLDGLKSPNVLDRSKNFPGLLTREDIDTTAKVYGVDSPQFWQMRRGFWAPEGIQKTVLTMPMIIRGRAREKALFDQSYVLGAALDPSFNPTGGGDRCPLRFGRCGLMDGLKTLEFTETLYVQTKSSTDDPVHYQIVRQVREACLQRGVLPYFFALDSTGEGGGLASIFQREWSREILCVEFGGRPSKTPISSTNPKRGDQEYLNAVTELWFSFRLLVQNGQVKGLDEETCTQFCRRWWSMKGLYIALETKAKMKERTRRSPDDADAAVCLARLFAARDRLLPQKPLPQEGEADTPWKRFLAKRNLVSAY